MYGLVNRGIKDFAMDAGGADLWEAIRVRANCEDDEFLSMQAYEDQLSMDLVAAASEELGIAADELLRKFGRFWVLFTGKEGYGPLMDMSGNTFSEFVESLDSMHARIKTSMPELQPPQFSCTRRSETELDVTYLSDRVGLVPMVEGLFMGLADKFGETVSLEVVSSKADEGNALIRITLH